MQERLTRGVTRRYQEHQEAGDETGQLEKSWKWWQPPLHVDQQDFPCLRFHLPVEAKAPLCLQ